MSTCRVCGQDINQGAKKCSKCGEYQNVWFRWLSGSVISSLIALVPICTLAFSFVYDRVAPQYSDLRFTLAACDARQVELFASNQGNRAAIFTYAEFFTGNDAASRFVTRLAPSDKLIEGGKTRAIVLATSDTSNPGGLAPFSARQQADCVVTVRVHSISFDQTPDSDELTCACPLS